VSQVSLNTVLKQQAYMLQYVRDGEVAECIPFQEPSGTPALPAAAAATTPSSFLSSSSQPKPPTHAQGDGESRSEGKRRKRKHRDKENTAPLPMHLGPAPALCSAARPVPPAPQDVGVVVRPEEQLKHQKLAAIKPAISPVAIPGVATATATPTPAKAPAPGVPRGDTQALVDAIFDKHVSAAAPAAASSQPPKAHPEKESAPVRPVNATGRWMVIDVAPAPGKPNAMLANGNVHPGRQQVAAFPSTPRFGAKTIRPWGATEEGSGAARSAARDAEREEERAASRHIKRPSKEDLLYDRGKPKRRKLLDPAFPVYRGGGGGDHHQQHRRKPESNGGGRRPPHR
jgi:hypothetical protein